jgi:hypothetical protein
VSDRDPRRYQFLHAPPRLIRDDRANALRLKNAFDGPSTVVLSFASVEPGQYVREKNLHADAMVGSGPFPAFRVANRKQLRLRDHAVADGASPAGHRAGVSRVSVDCDCSEFLILPPLPRTYRQRLSWFRGVLWPVFLEPLPVNLHQLMSLFLAQNKKIAFRRNIHLHSWPLK